MEKITRLFKALGSDRRIAILRLLSQREALTMTEIAKRINLSFRSTSKHLLILENVGMLSRRQERLNVYYALSERFRKELRRLLNLV
jgi:DNA-binding transcriptional ArsR family regulator